MRPRSAIIRLVPAATIVAVAACLAAGRAGGGEPAPGTGPLDLEDLVRLALENDPRLVRLRGEINVAKAKERAAHDLRDPELRLSYQRDHDVELPPSETETRTIRRSESGTQNRQDSSVRNRDGERSSSSRTESFDRETVETVTREIRPGASSDRIIETGRESVVERSSFSESGQEVAADGAVTPTGERGSRVTSERVTGRTVEDRTYDYNRLDPDSDFQIQLRFRVPNPWERKARIDQARVEVGMARALMRAAEHEVVIGVRRAYADLLEVRAELDAAAALSAMRRDVAAELDSLESRADLDDVIDAQGDHFRSELEVDALRLEFEEAATELAALCGLSDPSRIATDSQLAPRELDLDGLDAAFLYEIAEGYRGDLIELIHESRIAALELKQYEANRIPWFTFVEGFYGVEWDRGDRSADNYGVQVGVSLPIFTWFKNKEHEVHEQEIDQLHRETSAVRLRIHAELDAALAGFRRVDRILADFRTTYAKRRGELEERLRKTEDLGPRANAARFRANEALARLDESRAKVLHHYNDALLKLERALGADLHQVFATRDNPGVTPAAAGAPEVTAPRPGGADAGGAPVPPVPPES